MKIIKNTYDHYVVSTLTYETEEHDTIPEIRESETFEFYNEALNESWEQIKFLSKAELEKTSIWIVGWDGDKFPPEGADYEEQIL